MGFPAEFVLHKRHGSRIWLQRVLAGRSMVDVLYEPEALFECGDCQVIKNQRKIKIARCTLAWNGNAKRVYVKKYNAFSWRYRLMSLLIPSGAQRSLRGAAILARYQIPTAVPVAAAEFRRCGMLTRSYYLSEEIPFGKTADAYWSEDLSRLGGHEGMKRRRRFLSAIALILRRLHRHRIYHNDLKDANVMVAAASQAGESYFLLDLEGVRVCAYLSMHRKIKNLVQVNRTLGKYLATTQKLYFLKCYLGEQTGETKTLRWWVEQIVRATRKADQRSMNKISP